MTHTVAKSRLLQFAKIPDFLARGETLIVGPNLYLILFTANKNFQQRRSSRVGCSLRLAPLTRFSVFGLVENGGTSTHLMEREAGLDDTRSEVLRENIPCKTCLRSMDHIECPACGIGSATELDLL
jgi:hypothetical protein